jgi:hypothetical protein
MRLKNIGVLPLQKHQMALAQSPDIARRHRHIGGRRRLSHAFGGDGRTASGAVHGSGIQGNRYALA